MKKKWLFVIAFLIILLNFVVLFSVNKPDKRTITTFVSFFNLVVGYVSTAIGKIMLFVGWIFRVYITSPQNTTYNFTAYENFTIELNVSSNDIPDTWKYTLIKTLDNSVVYDNITFTPNTTFNAIRKSNKLVVWANNTNGSAASAEVIFYVYVPNTAPIIQNITPLLACEDTYFSYFFNVTDLDEDNIYLYLQPLEPFYIMKNFSQGNLTIGEIYSPLLTKNYVKTYAETVWAVDSQYADSKTFNITVIEINHPPSIENITTQTVWVNDTFYYKVNVTDLEDGLSQDGNLTFNLTFLSGVKFFDINTSTGIINTTPNISHIGVYNISICVSDKGLVNPHENLSLCNETNASETSCKNFSLTVTDENRKPVITSHYPISLNLTIYEGDTISFSITKYDPDGTIPDSYWYVDDALTLKLKDAFNYTTYAGYAGSHHATIEITDGQLNDSLTWNITILPSAVQPTPGGAGGALALPKCSELWACNEWGDCQDLESVFASGAIDSEIKQAVQSVCLGNSWLKEECGFQIRRCRDINECNKTENKPPEIQACRFVKAASCFDKILNCHHGGCEILADCGGPCPVCPTCSDGTQNQGEEGIDCGGPCPWPCPIEAPFSFEKFMRYLLILVILLLLIVIVIRVIKIMGFGKRRRYECRDCNHRWEIGFDERRPKYCPKCKSTNVHRI